MSIGVCKRVRCFAEAAQTLRDNPTADAGEITLQVEHEFGCGSWFLNAEWSFIWQCFTHCLSLPPSPGLRLGEVIVLKLFLVQFQELAEKAGAEWKEAMAAGRQRQKVYPILELKNTPLVQALDFSKSKKRRNRSS